MFTPAHDLAVTAKGSVGVIVFEERNLGRTRVNAGCLPEKLLVHACRVADYFREMPDLGWRTESAALDWQTLSASVRKNVRRLSEFRRKRLEGLGVTIVDADAAVPGLGRCDEPFHQRCRRKAA